MTQQLQYGVVGMGAVGGFYGAHLQRSGVPVHFLVRRDAALVRENGLSILSKPLGDFHVENVQVDEHVEALPPCDVVLVALKTTQNRALGKILPTLLRPGGVVLVLQNGLEPELEASRIVGAERIVGGLTFLCAAKEAPGRVRHWGFGTVTLGAYQSLATAALSARLEQVNRDFNAAGIATVLADNLRAARWHKLVWNIPFNGLSVILRAGTQALLKSSEGRLLVLALMHEVIQLARASGVFLPSSVIAAMLESTEAMPDYTTSMKLDFDKRRPLEIEAIFGAPLRVADQLGVEVPYIRMLHAQLGYLST